MWEARELLYVFIERDIKVRYRQAVLGVIWALLSPALLIIVFTLVFGMLARFSPEGVPYAVFLLPAMLSWIYFESALGRASNSLVQSGALLNKVYFPRLFLPLSNVISPLLEFALGLIVLVVVLACYRFAPHWQFIYAPAYLALGIVAALGTGMIFSTLNAYYRDVRHVLPALLRLWFFCTPIIYGVEKVPEQWRTLFAVNPMVSVTAGLRAGLIGSAHPTPAMLLASIASALLLLVVGYKVFRDHEQVLADVI